MKSLGLAEQKELYTKIANNLASRYPRMEPETLEFLATSEFLFNVHSSFDFDYSAIIIGYWELVGQA